MLFFKLFVLIIVGFFVVRWIMKRVYNLSKKERFAWDMATVLISLELIFWKIIISTGVLSGVTFINYSIIEQMSDSLMYYVLAIITVSAYLLIFSMIIKGKKAREYNKDNDTS